MKSNDTYFTDIYKNVDSTTAELNYTRRVLLQFGYLNDDENELLQYALHLLYEKIVAVGDDIQRYKEAETLDSELPEPLEEILTSLDIYHTVQAVRHILYKERGQVLQCECDYPLSQDKARD